MLWPPYSQHEHPGILIFTFSIPFSSYSFTLSQLQTRWEREKTLPVKMDFGQDILKRSVLSSFSHTLISHLNHSVEDVKRQDFLIFLSLIFLLNTFLVPLTITQPQSSEATVSFHNHPFYKQESWSQETTNNLSGLFQISKDDIETPCPDQLTQLMFWNN